MFMKEEQGLQLLNHLCKIMVISLCFLLFTPYAYSITFNLTKFTVYDQYREIDVLGGAYLSDEIELTEIVDYVKFLDQRVGWATYVNPLHLWDNTSGKQASFSTDFFFTIDSSRASGHGEGLTFFLAKNNSLMMNGTSLGLPVDESTNKTWNPFVAVEFDTFGDAKWDPRSSSGNMIGDHVGININSLSSVTYQKWFGIIPDRRDCQVWIVYDSVSKNLTVSFSCFLFDGATPPIRQELYHIIDLKDVLPEWVVIGFSAGNRYQLQRHSVLSWAFSSSDLQIEPLPRKEKHKTGLVVSLIVGSSVLITFLAVGMFYVWRKKKKSREWGQEFDVGMNNIFEPGTGPRKFSYRELARSTRDFSDDKKLGEGGFGGVYRGFLRKSNMDVAVKRVSKSSKQGIKEYASEVGIISRLRHRNLVQLKGWCHEKSELLLVYEFMENGSLDLHLFMAKSLLTWNTRYKIAYGLASALLYLHEEWEQCVLHRDIKSSNVMLDSNFNAKLGDFGLAKLVDHEKGSQTTMLAGTLGYMAPECIVTGKASRESDVFSFGVVALEIACGRKPIVYRAQENQIRLVEWVWESYGTGTLLEAADPRRLGSDYEEEEIKCLMIVGLWCVHPDPDIRPSMRQVIQVLNMEAPLPILPLKMPVASYLSSPMPSLSSIIQEQSSSSRCTASS